jgi:hypothetical protein
MYGNCLVSVHDLGRLCTYSRRGIAVINIFSNLF